MHPEVIREEPVMILYCFHSVLRPSNEFASLGLRNFDLAHLGSFHLAVTESSILDFIDLHNENEAKPFRWTASPERLVASRQRGYQKIETVH